MLMKKRIITLLFASFSLFCFAEETKSTATEKVFFKTNQGEIVIELNREKAPITVENFLSYVKNKHYDGTVFHRVIAGFMIQGGGYEEKEGTLFEKKSGKGIKNEGSNGLKNDKGTIAMARTGDPNSATAQFFINVNDNENLNYPQPDGHGYAVFGKVIKGMEIVSKIEKVTTGRKALDGRLSGDVPTKNIVIKSVELVK
jgi:peptidyl-prolyl cis-trans isomerase A (cyclophilin A)